MRKHIKVQGYSKDGQFGCFYTDDQIMADTLCELFFERYETMPADNEFGLVFNSYEEILNLLTNKYPSRVSINKEELAEVLGISKHTINHRLYNGGALPDYKKNGDKVQFMLPEVAKFLVSDMVEAKPTGWNTKNIFGKKG